MYIRKATWIYTYKKTSVHPKNVFLCIIIILPAISNLYVLCMYVCMYIRYYFVFFVFCEEKKNQYIYLCLMIIYTYDIVRIPQRSGYKYVFCTLFVCIGCSYNHTTKRALRKGKELGDKFSTSLPHAKKKKKNQQEYIVAAHRILSIVPKLGC